MNSRILEIARYTGNLLRNLHCDDDGKKLLEAEENLQGAIRRLKDLKLDQLCAIEEDKRQELTTHQQTVIEFYAKLKRTILEIYRDLFKFLKEV